MSFDVWDFLCLKGLCFSLCIFLFLDARTFFHLPAHVRSSAHVRTSSVAEVESVISASHSAVPSLPLLACEISPR